MKTISHALLFLVASVLAPAWAQQAAPTDRGRIALERGEAEARYAASEKACFAKFAVNDCVAEARARRREVLAGLRRQEVALNDSARKGKGAEKLRDVDERLSPEKREQTAAQRAKSMAEHEDRLKRAADQAAVSQSARAAAPGTRVDGPRPRLTGGPRHAAPKRSPAERKTLDTEENRRAYEARQDEARERRNRIEKNLAESGKPALKPLPVPP